MHWIRSWCAGHLRREFRCGHCVVFLAAVFGFVPVGFFSHGWILALRRSEGLSFRFGITLRTGVSGIAFVREEYALHARLGWRFLKKMTLVEREKPSKCHTLHILS